MFLVLLRSAVWRKESVREMDSDHILDDGDSSAVSRGLSQCKLWFFALTLCFAIPFAYKACDSFTGYEETIEVNVRPDIVLHVIDRNFLSLGLDTSFVNGMMKNLSAQDWDNLKGLMVHLSPGYLRLGGNDADRAVFNTTDERFVNISPIDLLTIIKFARQTGFRLLYDFNVLLRNGRDWDPSNAKEILYFLAEKNAFCDFQLGNEPNNFRHKFNVTLPPDQLGKDFKSLRSLLNSYDMFNSSLLVGPDVTRPIVRQTLKLKWRRKVPSLTYLSAFLQEGAASSLSALSWHQYYLNGRDASLSDFLNPRIFNVLSGQIKNVEREVRHFSQLPIWLSETGSAYGGGAPNLSDTYAATFLFLDKLGLSAKLGVNVVIRQSLLQGHYALIDGNLQPLPDFWIALAFKKLVGTNVYRLDKKQDDDYFRVYAHQLQRGAKELFLKRTGVKASILLYGMNLNDVPKKLKIGNRFVYMCFGFVFTAGDENLQSKSIFLNGKKLIWSNVTNFMSAFPYRIARKSESVPPHSLWFWILCNNQDA